jgi:ubiquinone biosynthesis protein
MKRQIGWRGFRDRMIDEAIPWSQFLPRMPRLVHDALAREDRTPAMLQELRRLRHAQERHTRVLSLGVAALLTVTLMLAWYFSGLPLP